MPIPGPRTQFGALPGFRNPENTDPSMFNRWNRPAPLAWPGESAGTGVISRRGNILGAGQIRAMWRQSVGYIPAAQPYSWTADGPQPGRQGQQFTGGVGITRAFRYMTRSVYIGAGDSQHFAGLHTAIAGRHAAKPITRGSGGRNRPTTRNRMTSFGARVPVLNPRVQAASGGDQQ